MSPRLHVTFSESAGGSLKIALERLGRTERVICLADDLGVGPINPSSVDARKAFYAEFLDYDDPGIGRSSERFWAEVRSCNMPLVAWLSRRCVKELTGFLELLTLRNEDPLVVDVADVAFFKRNGEPSPITSSAFSVVRDDEIIAHDLLQRPAPLTPEQVAAYRATWQRLKKENAPLRVLEPEGLASVPITYFDELLTSFVGTEWIRYGVVVGNAMGRLWGDFYQTSDMFLSSRICRLIDTEVFELRGEPISFGNSWLRLRT